MKKFSYTRSISQDETPILQRLQRRHQETGSFEDDDESWHEMALRSKSCGYSSSNCSLPKAGSTDCLQSSSTQVIKDAELTSSRIYKNKKAAASGEKIEALDPISPFRAPVKDVSDIESPRHSPSPFPIEMLPRRSSNSSNCCWFIVLLVIFVCAFGILSSIGGVIYLEVFAKQRSLRAIQLVDGSTESEAVAREMNQGAAVSEMGLDTQENAEAFSDESPSEGNPGAGIFNEESHSPSSEEMHSEKNMIHQTRTALDEIESPQPTIFIEATATIISVSNGSATVANDFDLSDEGVHSKPFQETSYSATEAPRGKGTDSITTVTESQGPAHTIPANHNSYASKRKGKSDFSSPPSGKKRLADLRASIAEAMKRFQTLTFVDHPSSRVQDSRMVPGRIPGDATAASTTDEEKLLYLDRLRHLMFDNGR